jgi:hypothetical protein
MPEQRIYRKINGDGSWHLDWHLIKQEGLKVFVLLVGMFVASYFNSYIAVRDLKVVDARTSAQIHRLAEGMDTFVQAWWEERHPGECNPIPKLAPTMPVMPLPNGGSK